MSRQLGLDLYASLELVRKTNCKPFEVVGLVQFMLSRIDFKRLVNKFINETRNAKWFDKMIVFGIYKGVIYNRIILIKYIDQ